MCPARNLLRAGLLLACCVLAGCAGGGTDKKTDESAKLSAASWDKVKEGMTLKEAEALLGPGTETTCPKGKGLPLGAYVPRDGDAKWVETKYRKWQLGDRTLVVGFFEESAQVKTEMGASDQAETRA